MKHSLLKAAASALVFAAIVTPVFAQGPSRSASSAKTKMTINTSCMATAVGKRDTTISTALQVVVSAISTRGTALTAAWGNADAKARKTAIQAANSAFNGSWKTFNTARSAAWKQYATDAKACKISPSDAGSATTTGGM